MKKEMSVFLCVATVLFFVSCSDLSMDDENAVKADLPADFDPEEYGKINNDVKMSQIIFDVRKKNTGYGKGEDSTSKAVSNCVEILKDENFAKKVYLNYMKCPEQGWNLNEKCSGIYANNGSYTKVDDDDNTTCIINGCWHGGWSELTDNNGWQDSLTGAQDEEVKKTINSMCQFIPPKDLVADTENYLDRFPYDSYLIEQHYHFFGRSDGRPYKYCDTGHGVEKTKSLADKRGTESSYYYDYSRYTFCLDITTTNPKIYVVQ